MADSRATIFALSTPPGRSAIAVFRLCGPRVSEVAEALTGRERPAARIASLRWILDPMTGEKLDHALITFFSGPHSYTGEDMLELAVHGGRSVSNALIRHLHALPYIRAAAPGEFTRRAFENGRLSLTEAEGIADLIDAETEFQRRQALRIADGGLKRKVEHWKSLAIEIAAALESQLDFSDEGDVGAEDYRLALSNAERLRAELLQEHESGLRSSRLRNGLTVVLAGPVNAGKSTLFNLLVGSERAIVSSVPGTTRDLLHADLDIGGVPIHLIDSAGLRERVDEVEQIGIERARQSIVNADLVLWLNAADARADRPCDDRTIFVWTKAEPGEQRDGWIAIDSVGQQNIDALIAEVASFAARVAGDGSDGFLLRDRHRLAASESLVTLHSLCSRIADRQIELAAEDCRILFGCLTTLGGAFKNDDVLDEIFGKFCIGK